MPPFALEGLDHIVLPVDNLDAVRDFYCDVIGCAVAGGPPEYGMLELRAGAALIVLVDVAGEPGAWARPSVAGGRNMDHLCIATGPWDEQAMRDHLAAHGVEIEEEDVHGGARGESLSFYVRDPAGNLIELKGP
jgi:catechol 2,3-dioxygenase-like lactoylglutathione lyase family enzyme